MNFPGGFIDGGYDCYFYFIFFFFTAAEIVDTCIKDMVWGKTEKT